MSRALEKLGKELFASAGIDVPDGAVAFSPTEAADVARSVGGKAVLKAHVPVGKRGKAGGVVFVETPQEAQDTAADLLGRTIHRFPVESILVEEAISIQREMYASVTFDSTSRLPVLVFSSQGGMDIETIAAEHPETVVKRKIDSQTGLEPFEGRQIAVQAGVPQDSLVVVGARLVQLVDAFRSNDATLVEINPLSLCDDRRVVAADAVVKLDDHAEDRHPDLFDSQYTVSGNAWRPPTTLERELHEADGRVGRRRAIRFIELDGDIGNCITGGGGSLMAMDIFDAFGGDPATYMDITPTRNPAKYEISTVAALKAGVTGLIFGGNILSLANPDIKARGLVDGLKRAGMNPEEFPVVVRLAGSNQEDAEKILDELPGIESLADTVTMEEAIERVIERTETIDEPFEVDVALAPKETDPEMTS